MSGKVAKPKEDKDASKGKKRALPCTDCFSSKPVSLSFFFFFFLKPPCSHSFPTRCSNDQTIAATGWMGSHSQHVHVVTAVWGSIRAEITIGLYAVCQMEITCFTHTDLSQTESLRQKAVARCFSLVTVFCHSVDELKNRSGHSNQTPWRWFDESDMALCHWPPVERSLCVSRSHRNRILILITSVPVSVTRRLVTWAHDPWRQIKKNRKYKYNARKKWSELPVHCHGHREAEKPNQPLHLRRGRARHFTHRHTRAALLCLWARFLTKQTETLINNLCGG